MYGLQVMSEDRAGKGLLIIQSIYFSIEWTNMNRKITFSQFTQLKWNCTTVLTVQRLSKVKSVLHVLDEGL